MIQINKWGHIEVKVRLNKPGQKQYTQIIQGLERTTEVIQNFLSGATNNISSCTEASQHPSYHRHRRLYDWTRKGER